MYAIMRAVQIRKLRLPPPKGAPQGRAGRSQAEEVVTPRNHPVASPVTRP